MKKKQSNRQWDCVDEEIVETTTNFSDYKVVDGFQFAHAFSMSVGKMTLTGVVKNISVNPKLVIGEDF